MIRSIQHSSKLIVLVLVIISVFGCQSKKKAMQASNAAAEKAKIEREAADRKMQAEEQARIDADEKAKHEAEQRLRESEANASNSPSAKLNKYFAAISTASNIESANKSISEALTMFASPETPVLIVISDSDGMKDYDKPTTIKDYLNYVKDQKKNINTISNVKTDSNGKVTELELKKN